MVESEKVTYRFSSNKALELGKALHGCYTASVQGRRYWVLDAKYRKRRDTITFKIEPAWFMPAR